MFTHAAFLIGLAVAMAQAIVADETKPDLGEDAITVRVNGTLRNGIFAIGAETTGTTIQSKGITWELDLGKNKEFRASAEKLNGKKVVVEGSLERRAGVEVNERWIVTVTKLYAAEIEKPSKPQRRIQDGQ